MSSRLTSYSVLILPFVFFSKFLIFSSKSRYFCLTSSSPSSNFFFWFSSFSLFSLICSSSAFFSSSCLLISSARCYLSCFARFLLCWNSSCFLDEGVSDMIGYMPKASKDLVGSCSASSILLFETCDETCKDGSIYARLLGISSPGVCSKNGPAPPVGVCPGVGRPEV